MNRTKFYRKVQVDGIDELDFLDSNLSKLALNRDVSYYRISSAEHMRPDVISNQNYQSVNFWWLICLVNNIGDPYFETTLGRMLQIPNLIDVYDFLRNYRVR